MSKTIIGEVISAKCNCACGKTLGMGISGVRVAKVEGERKLHEECPHCHEPVLDVVEMEVTNETD